MTNAEVFTPHHVALSVRDLEATKSFYSYLGFEVVWEWIARDENPRVVHMSHRSHSHILEVFHYPQNADADPISSDVGNDLGKIGLKHIGFSVPKLADVFERMKKDGVNGMSDVVHEEPFDYFFVPDPDGNWVEVMEDRRILAHGQHQTVREQ